jgi:ubiquinone/menaquinone biosynthesis C-methylase UbiE
MSLSRQLEPEVMDSSAEALAYDAMDHSEVNRQFVTDLLKMGSLHGFDPENDEPLLVLDIGTGTAQIPIELCCRTPDVRVRGIDLAVAMLDQARMNIEVEGMIEQISLAQVDAKDLPYDDGAFDIVMSNSIVHHIPQPKSVLAEALRVTRAGGLIFIRDLMRPANEGELNDLVATHAADATTHQRKMFEDSLRAALTLEEIQEIAVAIGLAADAVTVTSDRHWTLSAFKGTQPDMLPNQDDQ